MSRLVKKNIVFPWSSQRRWVYVLVLASLSGLVVSCQTWEKVFESRPEQEDSGVYGDGFVDARPAKAKLQPDAIVRWTVDAETRKRAEMVLADLPTQGNAIGDWAIPLLESYLPKEMQVSTVIAIDVSLPAPLQVQLESDSIRVDAGATVYGGSAAKLLTAARHEINRIAFNRVLQSSLVLSPEKGRLTWLLSRISRDGLEYYLSLQGDLRSLPTTLQSTDLTDIDESLDDPWAPLAGRFLAIDEQLSELSTSSSAAIWVKVLGRLERLDAEQGLFDKVGAYMAKTIERQLGKKQLVAALAEGPRAFYDVYQSTRPGALMSFRLPREPLPGVAH